MIVSTFPLEHQRHFLTLLIRKSKAELETNVLANTVGWHRHAMARHRLLAENKCHEFAVLVLRWQYFQERQLHSTPLC
jgi:hypothetical protein